MPPTHIKNDFCGHSPSRSLPMMLSTGWQVTARTAAVCCWLGCWLISDSTDAAVPQGFGSPPAAPAKPASTPDTSKVTTPKTTPKTTPFRPSFSQPKQTGTGQSATGTLTPSATSDSNSFGGAANLQTLPVRPPASPSSASSGFGARSATVAPAPSTTPNIGRGSVAPGGLNLTPTPLPTSLPPAITPATAAPKRDSSASPQAITKVSKSFSKLPNAAGQVWREYDITPYTSRIASVENPQQAIVDWILLETGKDMWFHQPLGILSADRHKLYVYHSPEIQAVVNRIVDRMVHTRGQLQSISVNLITIGNPNWRSESYSVMQPIDVRSPGVEAWMISKENAAYLLANLRRRPDFQEHGNGRLVHHDGQTVRVEKYSPLQFVQNIRWTPNQVPGYQPQLKTIQEGYELTLSSLTSLDGKSIEATIECGVDQVEKLRSVKIAIPGGPNASGAQVNLQIPQMVSWEIKERFRWPNDQVLVLSCGVVANPRPKTNNSLIPDLFEVDRERADALLFIEYRGPEVAQMTTQPQPVGMAPVQPRR